MKDPFELKANSIPALNELFPDEESCIRHLEALILGRGISPSPLLHPVDNHIN